MDAVKYYISKTGRRVTFEYILLRDINDTKECADLFADLIGKENIYVNLIHYKEVLEKPYKRSKEDTMRAFYDRLYKRGVNVQLRKEQGGDIDAACGQLRSKHMK
jgi:23S rRNA (adenine2503-C2)-methyltransferase